jgi:hypothetical protein
MLAGSGILISFINVFVKNSGLMSMGNQKTGRLMLCWISGLMVGSEA